MTEPQRPSVDAILSGTVQGHTNQPEPYAASKSEHSKVARALHVMLLAVAAGGDAMNFHSALGVLAQQQSGAQLWVVVAALTAAAVGSMHFVGMSARRLNGARPRVRDMASLGTLTFFWLSLGLSAFLLRLQEKERPDALTSTFGAAPAAATEGSGHYATTVAFAILMLCLYLATGAMAAWAAFHQAPYNSGAAGARRARLRGRVLARRAMRARKERCQVARVALRRAKRAHRRSWRKLRIADSRWEWLQAEADVLKEDLQRNEERFAAALASCQAGADELREHVRVRMATLMGDAASTNALTGQASSGGHSRRKRIKPVREPSQPGHRISTR